MKQKTLLLTQYLSTVDPEDQVSLKNTRTYKRQNEKFLSCRETKKRCHFKKIQEKFNKKPKRSTERNTCPLSLMTN